MLSRVAPPCTSMLNSSRSSKPTALIYSAVHACGRVSHRVRQPQLGNKYNNLFNHDRSNVPPRRAPRSLFPTRRPLLRSILRKNEHRPPVRRSTLARAASANLQSARLRTRDYPVQPRPRDAQPHQRRAHDESRDLVRRRQRSRRRDVPTTRARVPPPTFHARPLPFPSRRRDALERRARDASTLDNSFHPNHRSRAPTRGRVASVARWRARIHCRARDHASRRRLERWRARLGRTSRRASGRASDGATRREIIRITR